MNNKKTLKTIKIYQLQSFTQNQQFSPSYLHKQVHFLQLNLYEQFYDLLKIPVNKREKKQERIEIICQIKKNCSDVSTMMPAIR